MHDPILNDGMGTRESAPLCWGKMPKKAIAWVATGQCVLIFALIVLCGALIIHNATDDDDATPPPPSPPSSPVPPTNSTDEAFYFFQISDIHTDLKYHNDTLPLAQYGQDGGIALLNTLLSNMVALPGDPKFILITGDFPSHGLPTQQLQYDTIANVSRHVANAFPGVPVYPALGNNDVYPDYHFPLHNTTWMDSLAGLWGDELGWLSPDNLETFNPLGYYSVDSLWDDGPALLVLNTVMYSQWVSMGDNTTVTPPDQLPADPNNQFAWLRSQLESYQAQSRQAILAYHIPSGMNPYDNSKTWHENYTTQFESLCNDFPNTILVQVGGHYHTDEVRLVQNTGVLLSPSVSPDHTNNPTFRRFSVSTEGVLQNYHQYFLDLPRGNARVVAGESAEFELEYDFKSAYQVNQVDSANIATMVEHITNHATYYASYITHQYALYPKSRGASVCAMNHQEELPYLSCVDRYSDDEE